MTADLRYDKFGWDYEVVNPLGEDEVAWHLEWAQRTGGPALGLACGTGRLLCRLSEAGIETVGIDLSDGMLAVARRNVAALPAEARDRVLLVKADMADFHLGRTFGLVLVADNSFRELPTRAELLSCLACMKAHLKPGGKILITERRFDPAQYADGPREFGWSEPMVHPETGESISRCGRNELSADGRRIRGAFVYRTIHADGSETIDECPHEALAMQPSEFLELFDEANLATETFVGYSETIHDGTSTIISFVCEPKA